MGKSLASDRDRGCTMEGIIDKDKLFKLDLQNNKETFKHSKKQVTVTVRKMTLTFDRPKKERRSPGRRRLQ